MPKITKRVVDATIATNGKRRAVWDSELRGFGLIAYPSGAKVYVLRYFTDGGRDRRMKLGAHGELTPDQARRLAATKLVEVRAGADPLERKREARAAEGDPQTVAWLFDDSGGRYLESKEAPDAKRRWKAPTAREVRRIFETEIANTKLGSMRLREVTTPDVVAWHEAFSQRATPVPYLGNRALSWLSGAFGFAIRKGYRTDGINPCAGVETFVEQPRERAFKLSELERIGTAMEKAAATGRGAAQAMDALTLLALTGLRRNNVLALRWDEVDFEGRLLDLADTKGGKQVKGLGADALTLLEGRREVRREHAEYVFESRRGGPLRDVRKHIDTVFTAARIRGATPHHTWRHTYASHAGELGYTELTIAALLGHSKRSVTSRYVKLDKVVREAEERVQARIAAALFRRPEATVHPIRESAS